MIARRGGEGLSENQGEADKSAGDHADDQSQRLEGLAHNTDRVDVLDIHRPPPGADPNDPSVRADADQFPQDRSRGYQGHPDFGASLSRGPGHVRRARYQERKFRQDEA
jgi:hypothetical protein